MKLPDDFWAVREDEDTSALGFLKAGLTFIWLCVALYLAILVVGAVR